MQRSVRLACLLSWLLSACSADTSGGVAPNAGDPAASGPELTYRGPAIHAEFEISDSASALHAVVVRVEVPSGGYRLVHDEMIESDAGQVVRFTLTTPGDGEMTTQALETKSARVEFPGPNGHVRIEVKTVQRGAQYFVEPPYQLAAILGER